MKLIYVTSAAPFTVRESFLLPEMNELRRQGAELTVVPLLPRGPIVHGNPEDFLPISEREGVFSLRIVQSTLIECLRRPIRVLAALASIASSRTLKIALKNLAVFPKGLWLADLAQRKNIDHIHAQWGGCSSTMALIASRVSGIPWSLTLHRWDIPENNLLKQKIASTEFTRVIDENGRDELFATADVDAKKVVVVHVGVALPQTERISRDTNEPFRFVVPAFFLIKKGHCYLIEALAILRSRGIRVWADLAGNGPLESKIRRQVELNGLDEQVKFLGPLSHPELLGTLSRGEWAAVVLPSIVEGTEKEGIPVSLMEAMARGVPVISTNTGGIPELLHGGAGVLVPERDANALADAIQMLAENRSMCESLALRGRKRIEESFAVERTAASLIGLIQGSSPASKLTYPLSPLSTAINTDPCP